jgi:opacity protein-like surface antigen
MKRFLAIVVAVCCVVGFSSAQLGLKGIGGGVGYTSVTFSGPGSSESLGGFAIGGVVNLGEIVPGLSLVPDVGYWTSSKTISGVDWKVSDFVINGNVSYAFPSGDVTPYVGGGLGLNFFSTTVVVPFFGTVSGSESQLGINLLGGAAFALNDELSLGAQFRYVISSDANHFIVLATFMHKL